MRNRLLIPIAALLVSLVLPVGAAQAADATCSRPESDAEALYILAGIDQGNLKHYWWDDTSLDVAIRAHPAVTEEYLAAVIRAIDTWNSVLQDCLGGEVSLTYVEEAQSIGQADIVVSLIPRPAGGVVFTGVARCGPDGCQNVMISTVAPPALELATLTVEETYAVALHELGHALGLGHATNIESYDVMGYGGLLGDPPSFVISQCDVDALAYVWSWVLDGTEPTQPTDPMFECSG